MTPAVQAMHGSRCATARRNAAAVACPWGHPYTPENTRREASGKRHCRACQRAVDRLRRKKVSAYPLWLRASGRAQGLLSDATGAERTTRWYA